MTHLPQIIYDLGLILIVAAITTLIFKKIKQPLVLGYILAGFIVSPNMTLFPSVADLENVHTWSELGVIFLLFTLGLEFSFKKLAKVGAPASITGITEIVLMIAIGYLTGQLLQWSQMDSLFLGAILAMSSTTIIIRAFEEVGVKAQKYVGLVFGILIVEDLIAIVLMVLLSTIAISKEFTGSELTLQIFKLIFFLIAWFLAGIFIIPTLLKKTKKLMSDETLMITSLGLCLLMVILSVKAGFSAALGAFIMGSIFAETMAGEKIEHIITPIKNLFAAIFFVSVGMLIDLAMVKEHIVPIIIITLVTIIGKFLASMIGALLAGQSLKRSVQTGMSLAQIGEFSFIIASLGMTLNVTSNFLYPITVAASAITTLTTPYLIKLSEPTYEKLEQILPEKWSKFFGSIQDNSKRISNNNEWKIYLSKVCSNTVIMLVINICILLFCIKIVHPYISKLFDYQIIGDIIAFSICALILLPSIWGLSLRKVAPELHALLWNRNAKNKMPLLMVQMLRLAAAFIVLCFLITDIFNTYILVIIAILVISIVGYSLSNILDKMYQKMEQHFLMNLNDKDNYQKEKYVEITPWDAHLAHYRINADWKYAGQRLLDLQFRELYGVNVVMIERGTRLIVTPRRLERIFPNDVIWVIGTDNELEVFEHLFNELNPPTDNIEPSDVKLKHLTIEPQSIYAQHTIRMAFYQSRFNLLIVGLERAGQQILNPDSETLLQEGDIIWMIGPQHVLNGIIQKQQKRDE